MKIIQISATETMDDEIVNGTLYALADDGSIWMLIDPWKGEATERRWTKLPDPKDGESE